MPADWVELSVDAPPEYVEPLSEVFHRYGEGGVAVEQPGGFNPDEGEQPGVPDRVTVKAYLPLDHTTDHRRAQIDVGVRLVGYLAPLSELRERIVTQDEWQNSWKDFFDVLRVGSRIVVCPTWRDHSPRVGDVVVRLDPGMAFGTGHHPTTRMCLESIERILTPGDAVLDMGCGSGILSIAAAKLGAGRVVGLEIDANAVGVGRANVDLNGVRRTVDIVQGTLPSPKAPSGSFDLVTANISARVIEDLAAHLVHSLAPGGTLLASGIIDKHVPNVVGSLESCGATVDEQLVDGDWVALIASA